MENVSLICPVHRRHRYLEVALGQFERIPCAELHVFYFADRATNSVRLEIERLASQRRRAQVHIAEMPFPIVDGQRGDFPKAWDHMLEIVRRHPTHMTFAGIWDDDMVLSDPSELEEVFPRADLIYGTKLFLWDDPARFNDRFEHTSVVFFRVREGDRFHPKRELQVHAPRGVHDDPASRRVHLSQFILDYGFMTASDRRQVFAREVRTGKIDNFTRPLVEPPDLKSLPASVRNLSRQFAKQFGATS